MRYFPIFRGKKINRMLCITFLVLVVILTPVYIFAPDIGYIFALIAGGFAMIYGYLWRYWAKKEKEKERKIREMMEPPGAQDVSDIIWREYPIPREALLKSAAQRVISVGRWSMCAAAVVFILITAPLVVSGSFGGTIHAFSILFFCVVISALGPLIQEIIYITYKTGVPRKIGLYPAKIIINDKTINAADIKEIMVSPEKIYNPDSPDIFRKIVIKTNRKTTLRIDYRADKSIQWEEYPEFLNALCEWGKINRVKVIVMYMQ